MDEMKGKWSGFMKKVNNQFSSSGNFKGQGRVLGSSCSGPVNPILTRPSPPHTPSPKPIPPSSSSSYSTSKPSLPSKSSNSDQNTPSNLEPPRKPENGFDPYGSLITSSRVSKNGFTLNMFECPICGAPYVSEDKEKKMAIQLNHFQSSLLKQEKQPKPLFFTSSKTKNFGVNTAASSSGQQLIQSGEVKPILPKDAATALNSEGFKLLDIRPQWEREKAYVKGSLHVPLFVKDMDNSPITLLKKWVRFGYIGLWTGQNFTMINPNFVQEVEATLPDKDAKLLVACGEGLRSMMATSKLYEGGYKNLGWLAGGFNRAADSDFPEIEGPEKLQYATIGGVSYYFLQLLLLLQAVGKE